MGQTVAFLWVKRGSRSIRNCPRLKLTNFVVAPFSGPMINDFCDPWIRLKSSSEPYSWRIERKYRDVVSIALGWFVEFWLLRRFSRFEYFHRDFLKRMFYSCCAYFGLDPSILNFNYMFRFGVQNDPKLQVCGLRSNSPHFIFTCHIYTHNEKIPYVPLFLILLNLPRNTLSDSHYILLIKNRPKLKFLELLCCWSLQRN